MDIQPVSLSHYLSTYDGRMVEVTDDVLGVARDIAAIGREHGYDLRLRWSEVGGYFVVYQVIFKDGRRSERFVLTAQQLDERVTRRVREIVQPDYDLAGELEQVARDGAEAKKEKAREQLRAEGDRIAHALRVVTRQPRTRIFVP